MGIVKKLGKPITAARPQNSPRNVKQGPGGPAAESQIAAPPEPFRNPRGAANFQRNRTNQQFNADQPQGSSAGGLRPRSPQVAEPRSQPMSDNAVVRGAGYSKAPSLAGYAVHNVALHRFDGTPAPRGRQASEVTRGRNTVGRKRLIAPMTDQDFLEGAKLYRKEHGSL
jgi:hypothetical protein